MKRWCIVLGLLGVIVGVAPAAEALRARWSGSLVEVAGVDAQGRVRLRPVDGEGGEALVPLADARGLRFELSADYRRGRELAQGGRNGEALLYLRRIAPALVPYAGIAESNAETVVRLYVRLLLQDGQWADALAVWLSLDAEWAGRALAIESAALARGLEAAGRMESLRLVLERWWVPPGAASETDQRATAEALAAELREDGHWQEAALLVQKLQRGTTGDERQRFDLLLAYLDWHQGRARSAQALLQSTAPPAVETASGVLYRLLQGRLRLQAGEAREALDTLAEALVVATGIRAWRVELTAVLAASYREIGDEETAGRIAADLRRQYPGARWVTADEGDTL